MLVYTMDEKPNDVMQFEAEANRIDTGLVPVTAPVTLPDGWGVDKALALIDALARDLYDEAHVLKQYTLTPAQFNLLKKNEWFAKAVEVARAAWSKADNVNTRLAIETALALEKNLPALAARLGKSTEPLQSVVALAKLFAEIAGNVGTARAPEQGREKFKIVFNLGADVQQFDKSRPLVQINSEGAGNSMSLQQLLETPGVPAPIQGDGQGS